MNNEVVKVHIGDKIVKVIFSEFDEIDTNDLTQIHYNNLFGEIVTVSTLLNRVGLLKAKLDNRLEEEKLELQVFEAAL